MGLGGVTRTFRNWPERVLALALTRRGHEVWNIGTRDRTRPAIAAPRERIEGVEVRRVRPGYWPNRELDHALDELPRPDVLHLMHPRNTLAAQTTAWARRRGIPTVYTWLGPFHDPYLVEDRERPFDRPPRYANLLFTRGELLLRLLRPQGPRAVRDLLRNYRLHSPLKQATRLLPCSRFEADVMRHMGLEQPLSVVPLWIEWSTEVGASLAEPFVLDAPRPWILFVGQLTARKGWDVAIDALPTVRRGHPAATLLVVSGLNPAERAEAEARGRSLGVSEGLRFLGRLEDDALGSLFSTCDAYWTPTRYEGFGLTVLEAMAAGAPVVAADVPAVNEVVEDGVNGLLFRDGDSEALAQTTLRLLATPDLRTRLGAGGRRCLAERFDGARLVELVEEAYTAAQDEATTACASPALRKSPHEQGYFADQLRQSDRKIGAHYNRLLRLGGLPRDLPAGEILDLGCGAGPGLRYLAQRGRPAVGLDGSMYGLLEARRLTPVRGLIRGDLAQGLPFQSGRFVLVLASELIEHLRDGPGFLRECRRILQPGGVLLLTTPNLWDVRRLFSPLLGRPWSGHTDPTHINLYTPARLRRELKGAGFAARVVTGLKPMAWLPPYRKGAFVPYPPFVGNGIVARGERAAGMD